MMHIRSLCKLIDYLKTVNIETSHCIKGNNADSKKYTLSFQCFHRSRIFTFLNLYDFFVHHNWANLIASWGLARPNDLNTNFAERQSQQRQPKMPSDIVLLIPAAFVILLGLHQFGYSWLKKVNAGIMGRLLLIDSSKDMPLINLLPPVRSIKLCIIDNILY